MSSSRFDVARRVVGQRPLTEVDGHALRCRRGARHADVEHANASLRRHEQCLKTSRSGAEGTLNGCGENAGVEVAGRLLSSRRRRYGQDGRSGEGES
jgi:hypothetical protein